MNQIIFYTIEAEFNGKPYRLSLPIQTAWTEVKEGVQFLADTIAKIAEDAEKRATELKEQQEAEGGSSEAPEGE